MVSTIVLAAGGGTRFGTAKQFELLGGLRLVDHAVRTALSISAAVVVVLPEGHIWQGPAVHAAVVGGATRAASVRCGLAAVPEGSSVVVVHDAAHPLAARELFDAAIAQVRAGAAAAAPVLPVTETLAYLDMASLASMVSRERPVAAVQAPQAFRIDVLRGLMAAGMETRDEVSLFLGRGHAVAGVPGDPWNVHVTTREELDVVRALFVARGFRDGHRSER